MSKPLDNINRIKPDDENHSHEIPTQAQLDAAIPAEITYRQIIDSIDARIHAPPNNGVWLCCNQHHEQENHIKHYQGDYPFKYLTCKMCRHIYCSSCSSSEILTPLESLSKASLEERFDSLFDVLIPERLLDEEDIEVRFFQLCRACGLTRRAIFEEPEFKVITACPCAKTAVEEEKYIDFFIGSNRKYRDNGDALTQELRLTRIFAAHDRVVRERRAESRKNKSVRFDMDRDSQHLAPSTRPRDSDKVPGQGMDMKWPMHTPWPEHTRFKMLLGGGFIIDPESEEPGRGSRTAVRSSSARRNTAASLQQNNGLYIRRPGPPS
jgi:hypothetical protein